jgi:hypothetical protein
MKVTNPDQRKGFDATRGSRSTVVAGSKGMIWRDASTESVGQVYDMTVYGLEFVDNGDQTGTLSVGGAGGGPGTGGTPTSSAPVKMLNNSGQDLLPGDVVVTDATADTAVTVTTDVGSILIAGIVQEPIAIDEIGPVLFNGYAPIVNASDITRGEYARTMSTAGKAEGTASRVAGSFAVFLTGNDLANFVSAFAVTEQESIVTTLDIDMPPVIPTARFLFLVLWLADGVSSVSVPGWTRIGAEADFWYFYRVSDGVDDTATATWTGASPAVACVLLTHDTVSLAVPIEAHDYENTTSAAAVSGLSDVPRYAVSGVRATATPSSDWTVIGSGEASPGAVVPSVVQSKAISATGTTFAFDSAVTAGNLLIACGENRDELPLGPVGAPPTGWTNMPSPGGVFSPNLYTAEADNYGHGWLWYRYAQSGDGTGPWTKDNSSAIIIAEFANVTGLVPIDAAKAQGDSEEDGSSFSELSGAPGVPALMLCGVATRLTTGDLVATGSTNRIPSGGSLPTTSVNHDNPALFWGLSPSGAAFTFTGTFSGSSLGTNYPHGWRTGAFQYDVAVEGTLAGKYIDHDAAVTSPFSGAGEELDGVFALNLMRDAMPSALLYGPDLNEAVGAEASYAWQPLFNSGDGTAIIDSGTGNPILAFAPV